MQPFAFQSVIFALASLALALPLSAADKPKPATKPKPPQRHQQIDHGPFVTATIPTQWEEGGIVNKGIAVRLKSSGDNPVEGGILFDTDTCRVAAGWVGGFVEFTKDWTSVRDSKSVKIVGTQVFGTRPGPGWAKPGASGEEAWKDPRPQGFGPLPKEWVKYKGLYRVDTGKVVFAYSVGDCDILDAPVAVDPAGRVVGRTIEVGPSRTPLNLVIAERDGSTAKIGAGDVAMLDSEDDSTRCLVLGPAPQDAKWVVSQGTGRGLIALAVEPRDRPVTLVLRLWNGKPTDAERALSPWLEVRENTRDLPAHHEGGVGAVAKRVAAGSTPLWPQEVVTAGSLGQQKSDLPYVVDTITLPDDNPWKSWMRPGGFDFFTSDPTKAAVCNWSGDVWVVSGIDDSLKELKWRRIASGLFQALGLRIVNDQIYVLGRDQITRLVDLNGDGETDFYENFNNDVEVTPNFHEFMFDLQTDAAGNFYFAKGAPVRNGGQGFETIAAHHGSILKLSPDGKTLERYATGFRAPNGIGVGPNGEVTAGDNEGTWVPKCRLVLAKPGGFYGVVETSHRDPKPTDYDRPLCWFPKDVDNSSGGQVWVTSDKWGPLNGRLLHLSYGTSSLYLVQKEEVNGQVQGGVVRFPLSFESGIMRARFNPKDGQLYVAGLKGWQTNAGKDGCFQRVRYTGKGTPTMPTGIEAKKDGLLLTFGVKLNAEDANDPDSYSVERWNYLWSGGYGSKDYSLDDEKKQSHDAVEVESAKLQPDGKSVFLKIPDMKPAMQYKTTVNLTTAEDDQDVRYDVYHTIHELPR